MNQRTSTQPAHQAFYDFVWAQLTQLTKDDQERLLRQLAELLELHIAVG